ncbi:hypothetical protein T02_2308 [Trichinella nativa]|uniref:Uncharacterized protein n=1 Tax=Trichinella nativa TaxID=6335 RepID=A0A0V1KKM9_9BILA|nr:hypothetical protein T09_5892 [Trichinella sp. T9]KRZ47429.1 hypothetical protein T02_2308 [Trichinella nativa]
MEVEAGKGAEEMGKPFKGSASVATPGKLFLLIKLSFLLG